MMPAKIAEDILSVQPMKEAGKALLEIYEMLKPSEEFPNGCVLSFGPKK